MHNQPIFMTTQLIDPQNLQRPLKDVTTITVTSHPGQPSLYLSGRPSPADLAALVKSTFGMQVQQGWMLPHNFCGRYDG